MLLMVIGVGNVWGTTVTYTQSSTTAVSATSGTAPTGSSCSFSTSYTDKNQLTGGNSHTLTLTSLGGISISNITLSMKSNKSGGAGKLSYSTNGGSTWTYLVGSNSSAVQFNNAAWHGSYSTSYVNISKTVSLTNVTQLKIKIEATANSLYCQSFTITYTAAASCSNSVALSKGSATNGTVNTISSASVATCSATASDRRVTVTITPAACYDAPTNLTWTKSSGTVAATKRNGPTDNGDGTYSYVYEFAQNDNGAGTFGVTCTAKDPGKTVNFDAGPGTCLTSSLTETCDGSGVTLPAVTASGVCKGWTTFAGWATAAVSDSTTTSGVTLYAAGDNFVPASNGQTLYAVYSKSKGGGGGETKQVELDLTSNTNWQFPAGSSNKVYSTTENSYTSGDYTIKVAGDGSSSNGYYFHSNGYFLIGKSGAYIKLPAFSFTTSKIVVVGNSGASANTKQNIYVGSTAVSTETTSSASTQTYEINSNYQAAGNIYQFQVTSGHNAQVTKIEVYSPASTTYYCSDPNCCTPLGTINGSISENTPTSVTLTWSAVSGAEKYQVKVPGSSSHNDWTDAVSGVSVTKSCGTAYTAYFRAIDTNGSHCAEGPESTLAIPAVSWTVTSTGVTNATASPAIPSTTCSGFSTTISAATGYALPAEIAVTNASKTWNSSTGALTISSVTGNVSITITPTCVPPVISGDPADASYYVGDSPDALSVSATLASGTRTYLWKVSTNGGSTWSDATGTNNAATYSGASLSTASAETLKFKCIVGNSEGGCTVESEVATITVAEPSSWKFKYSGDEWIEHTMIEDAGEVSYSISLAADSRFEFGFDGGSFYKNNGTIITTTSGWVFNTTDNNCHIHTGPAGIYTFTINTTTKAVTVTYPTVSHPNEHYVYFKNTNVWGTVYGYLANSENDNKAAAWPGSVMQPTTSICGETYHYAALNAMSGTYNTIIFNNGSEGYGNQTSDLSTTGSLGKYNANQDANWHQFKYAINFDKGTGSGDAMVSIENLCPGSNQALTANTYTKEHNTFAGWIADVDVKVGESTIDAGEIIDDEVTIKDIQSDINLTAQWTPDTYTITKTLTNVANAGLPSSFTYTGATTTALNSTFTVDATNFFLPSSIAVTMGGTPLTAGTDYTYNNSTGAFTFSAVITGDIDITATATAKLKSIAITTLPTTRKYFAGESFSSTGAVVTATMGDGSTKPVSVTWDLTTLTAGAGQTVTASYSEGGIDQTATTTIDVYSVTVNKVNEDGDAIDVAGVTASWTVGAKALAAGVGSTKYAFKQWEVTGASIGSTTSASTTLSSPTANVVVNAVFWKPRTVKWSVNGNDSYNTGSPTTTVAYNGTISAVPTAPADNTLSCTNKFMGWSTKDAGTTPKTTSYYDDLFTNASGYTTNITAATTTFYAVFAEQNIYSGRVEVNTTNSGVSGGGYASKTFTVDDIEFAYSNWQKSTNIQAKGSNSPSLKNNDAFPRRIDKIVVKQTGTARAVSVKGKNFLDSDAATAAGKTFESATITQPTTAVTMTFTFPANKSYPFFELNTPSNAVYMDSVVIYYKEIITSNYVTECDANIVKVTYDVNGGATSCTNTTTDKTEDYTVCSTPPTRDYYTFDGWLCDADGVTYNAGATIDDAAIDADFTLTAQWTPVPYTITYNYNGGSAQVDPVPATSYTVESSAITLQTPTRDHDRFDGWYENADLSTGGVKTTIAAGSHENKIYYAKWTARHEIVFDADGATTTIYRADDENMEDAVTGMGSKPANPSAPSACSTKVFVGWSESTIDDETDTEPADLFDGTGTVDEDKHYYAVWANEYSESGTVKLLEDALNITGSDQVTTRSGWTLNDKMYAGGGSIRFSTGGGAGMMTVVKTGMGFGTTVTTATITFKIKKYGSDTSGDLQISSGDSDAATTFSKDGGLTSGSSVAYSTTDGSNWTTCTCTVANIHSGTDIILKGTTSKRVYVKDFLLSYSGTVYTYDGYSTSCCATKVTLSDPSITGTGATITFDKVSPVATCDGSKTVTATVTVTAGYQVTELSFSGGSVSVSPTISTPITSTTNYTLTFAEGTNATLTTTATAGAKPLNSITITPSSGEVYVGQYVDFTVSYDPADYLSKGYTLNATPVYVTKESAAPANTKLRLKGGRGSGPGASITETVNETVTIKASGDNTKTASVNMTVNPLPRVHFEDLVHGKPFADVAATIVENALSATKTTPTSDDWTTPNANECEENHLHLVGWIRSDWPALVAYLAGTSDAPTTVAITGAGNDGSDHAYYIEAGASIDVEAQNGKTFYAVWSKIE